MSENTAMGSSPVPHGHRSPGSRSQADEGTYCELFSELQETRHELRLTRGELSLVSRCLNETLAQANHDRALIIGMQSRVSELQRNFAHVRENHLQVSMNTSPHAAPGPFTGRSQSCSTESTALFPDLEDNQATPNHESQPASTNQNDGIRSIDAFQLTAPGSNGPISPDADLFSPFPSVVLGPCFHQPVQVEDGTLTIRDFNMKFTALWGSTETYAKAFTNAPDAVRDRHISFRLFDHYTHGASKEIIASLLNDDSSRFLVVSKVISSFVESEILKIHILRAFGPTMDPGIGQPLNTLRFNTSATSRPHRFDTVYEQVDRLRRTPLFHNRVNKRMHECTHTLLEILSPLIRHREDAAFKEMAGLMQEAHELALQIFSGPYDFQFTHPRFGDPFDPLIMVGIDSVRNQAEAPDALDAARSRFGVWFSITPIIYLRDANSTPASPMRRTCASRVILTGMGNRNHSEVSLSP